MIDISVVIPTYNRVKALRECLEALAHQTAAPGTFEVVVVVDGSTDATLEMLSHLQQPYPLQIIKQSNNGQCAALNLGAQVARGNILIFIDDDIIASPGLVSEHLRLHEGQANAVGIGKITLTLPPDADWYSRCFAVDWDRHYQLLDQGSRPPTFQDCFGGNMSVSRADFLSIGGNDVTLHRAYDIDLAYRLMCTGSTFFYLPLAIGDQKQLKGYRELTSDADKSGVACVLISKKHPGLRFVLLGSYNEQRPIIAAVLRILLALNLSCSTLERIGRLFGRCAGNYLNYQIIARYSFWRAVRRLLPDRKSWQALTRGVPILMYHAFSASNDSHQRYILPIHKFKAQMAWLKLWGYQVIGLQEYINCRRENRLPPERAVIITIDDGYADNWSLAYPILRKYAYPATVFPVSRSIGGQNTWSVNNELTGRPMLSWQKLLDMQAGGMDFGAHTRTHPDLLKIPSERVIEEISGSRDDLEQRLGRAICLISYPYGTHNPQIEALAEQAGFQAACSTDEGKNSLSTSLFKLRRVEIWGSENLFQFANTVHYGLDPLSIKRKFQNSLNRWR